MNIQLSLRNTLMVLVLFSSLGENIFQVAIPELLAHLHTVLGIWKLDSSAPMAGNNPGNSIVFCKDQSVKKKKKMWREVQVREQP